MIRMKIGISVSSTHEVADPQKGAERMVERAKASREADLDSLFVGDHHVTPFPYFQNSVILARMLAEWSDKPFGALYLLPLWHPVILAEQIATLSSLAPGPFIMQCGMGDSRQGKAMGIDMGKKVGRFVSSLRILRDLWAGKHVDEEKYWNLRGARISPVPDQKIEVWVGAMVEKAIERTARIAEGWLASPGLTPDESLRAIGQYKNYCRANDREPNSAIRRDVYIGASSAEAKRVVTPYIDKGYRGMSPDALMFGSVSEVAEQIRVFQSQGYSQIIVRNISKEQDECLETISRFKEIKEQVI